MSQMKNYFANISQSSPRIGMLTQDIKAELNNCDLPFTECFNSQYPGYLVGSRVIPISLNMNFEKIKKILPKLNGFFFAGGLTNVYIENKETGKRELSHYALVAFKIINEIIKINENGIYFPIGGICLGFQILAAYFAQDFNILTRDYNVKNDTTEETSKSRMLNFFTKNEQDQLLHSDFWNHTHYYSITIEDYYKNNKITESCYLTTTSKSKDGKFDFVSSIESKKYPFYGVIFHIERNLFGFPNQIIIQNEITTHISKKMSNFFLSEYQKNLSFFTEEDEKEFPEIKPENIHPINQGEFVCLNHL